MARRLQKKKIPKTTRRFRKKKFMQCHSPKIHAMSQPQNTCNVTAQKYMQCHSPKYMQCHSPKIYAMSQPKNICNVTALFVPSKRTKEKRLQYYPFAMILSSPCDKLGLNIHALGPTVGCWHVDGRPPPDEFFADVHLFIFGVTSCSGPAICTHGPTKIMFRNRGL